MGYRVEEGHNGRMPLLRLLFWSIWLLPSINATGPIRVISGLSEGIGLLGIARVFIY